MFGKRFCRRPWGWWLVLLDRKHFKVKLLRFRRGGKLSMQYHNYREEVWLILSGFGEFLAPNATLGNALQTGAAIRFGEKQWHQYVAHKPTYVLEIQYGEKCIEEDIVRV